MAQSSGAIKGEVVDHSGQSIPYANVLIKGMGKGTTADEHGIFELGGLAAGKYNLVASSIGFKGIQRSVDLGSGEIVEVQFILRNESLNLAEMVVSASRNPESIDEVPSSFTILPRKTLDESMIVTTNIIDILSNNVPGLGPSTGTSSNWGQTLRGRPLLIMVDGVPQSTPLRNGSVDLRSLDPDLIERVEVIKGATAVYGNGAAGGLVNYITRTPRTEKAFNSRTSIGSTGSLSNIDNSMGSRLSQMFYGKAGKLDYVVSGVFEQTGEWKDAEGDVLPPTYGLGETDSYNAFLKLGYDMSPKHRLQFSYNYYSSEQKTNYISEFGNYEEREKTKAVLGTPQGVPQGVRGNHNASLRFSGKEAFGNTNYEVDLYYQSVDNVFFQSDVFIDGGQSLISSDKKGLRFQFNTPLLSSNNINGSVLYGLDLMNDVTSQPLVDGRQWVPEMDMFNTAPFAQLKMDFFDELVFKGGLRFEKVNIGVEDYKTLATINTSTGEVNPSFDVKGGELTYNTWLFNTGLRYNKWKYFSPYLSFSQGFSVADIGVMLRSARVNDMKDINTEPVVVNNYETGFLSEFDLFRFEAVGYISTSELGTSGKFVDGVFEVLRSPERIHGLELVLDAEVTSNLTAGVNYAYVEGKMDVNDNGSYRDSEDTYLGGERISAPKMGAYLRYILLDEKVSFKLQYSGVGNRDRFEKNEAGSYDVYKAPVEAYHIFDLAASYKVNSNITMNLGIQNLFNEDYFPARSQWFTRSNLYTKGKGASFNISAIINL
ncbi:TonB-dependent receptor [Echinicola marina]|uniref:TonB-dependent receptor n=1 Tax=Echinicola marina TaxID=2859768 RepID=UPI001CF62559|nr:TonB-dependent receptor [Echinicola marina]UCS92257.1 TonB-dependent receptor [Echinicola marina]